MTPENQPFKTEDSNKNIKENAKQRPLVTREIAQEGGETPKNVSKVPQISEELERRRKRILNFCVKKKEWIFYLILAFITFIGVYVRTRNIDKLKDITTGTWTLGPDLDPFLFLRWTEYIVENGSLMVVDMMRNVPIGFQTGVEMKLLPYLMAWFYHLLNFFSQEITVTYAAIIFPVVMFGLTTIAFFLFARKVFYKESKKFQNIAALIATALFVAIPSLLPRTIAGIPEKESAAFFFIFMAFYFFLEAFTSKTLKKSIIWGGLSGITTGLLAFVWGGVTYVFVTIAAAVLFAFLLGKIGKKEFYAYCTWALGFSFVMLPFSIRYTFRSLIGSTSTGLAIGVFFILFVDVALQKINFYKRYSIRGVKIPKQIISIITAGVLLMILASVFFGPSFIYDQGKNIIEKTVHPLDVTRWGLTVAENRQPYFVSEWKSNFGPIFRGVPVFFWLFFAGSVLLFENMIKKLRKKERAILTFSYVILLFSLIFSRYSPSSSLNGNTGLSFLVYFGGVVFFLGCFGYFYYQRYLEGDFSIFKEFNFAYILYFIILTLTIIGARGAVRLIMVLGAVSPIAVAFLVTKTSQKYFKAEEDSMKLLIGAVAAIIIIATLFTFWTYYKSDRVNGEHFAPGAYQWQWQKAMAWVRDNVREDAVFAHWWDYGYWVQSIGKRATILDGGNAIVYWNYLMGRHVLTGSDELKALEFLYTHGGTHLLIDSTEIGKYTAYSSIGSDVNYDRFSWISSFFMDERQTQETKNETIYFYTGGTVLDEDIIWEQNGREILFPKRVAGVGAIVLKKDAEDNLLQPNAIIVYQGQQYWIPLRFVYYRGNLYDFESGLDAGIFIFPKIDTQPDGGIRVNDVGAAFYLSKRTIHSHLAKLYLFGQDTDYFKLVHTESSVVTDSLRQQEMDIGEFVYYQGFQGPIKIWEINYPDGLEANPDYLLKEFPDKELTLAKPGEYN